MIGVVSSAISASDRERNSSRNMKTLKGIEEAVCAIALAPKIADAPTPRSVYASSVTGVAGNDAKSRSSRSPTQRTEAVSAMKLIEKNGFDHLHLAFFKKGDIGNDRTWEPNHIASPSINFAHYIQHRNLIEPRKSEFSCVNFDIGKFRFVLTNLPIWTRGHTTQKGDIT